MFIFKVTDEKIIEIGLKDITDPSQSSIFGFIGYEESEAALNILGLDYKPITDYFENKSMIYQNHEGFDMIWINVLNHKSLSSKTNRICVYVRNNLKLFICSNVQAVMEMMYPMKDKGKSIDYNRLISTFFERLIDEDPAALDKIENEIYALENALITSKKRDCVNEIISLRKRLMIFKRYYEQLLNILDELQQNENRVLDAKSLRHFKVFSGKVERFYQSVLHLRDYVTQVREAYQAEVDISLNNTMKIFTVITAIFLPLTLIVGWYGMNLQMPEFRWSLGYPMVILLSIAVVVFCLIYFKKHKWF